MTLPRRVLRTFADAADTITVVHRLTAEDTPPAYPPPPASPAERHK